MCETEVSHDAVMICQRCPTRCHKNCVLRKYGENDTIARCPSCGIYRRISRFDIDFVEDDRPDDAGLTPLDNDILRNLGMTKRDKRRLRKLQKRDGIAGGFLQYALDEIWE